MSVGTRRRLPSTSRTRRITAKRCHRLVIWTCSTERLVGSVLCSPGLRAVVNVAGLTRDHFPAYLGDAFVFALTGSQEQTLQAARKRGEIARLFGLGAQLSQGQALHTARQIRETVERERSWAQPSRSEQ